MLNGKTQPRVVHELLGQRSEADWNQQESCAIFADALAAFRKQSWDAAAEKSHRTIKNAESDRPCYFYLKLCEE